MYQCIITQSVRITGTFSLFFFFFSSATDTRGKHVFVCISTDVDQATSGTRQIGRYSLLGSRLQVNIAGEKKKIHSRGLVKSPYRNDTEASTADALCFFFFLSKSRRTGEPEKQDESAPCLGAPDTAGYKLDVLIEPKRCFQNKRNKKKAANTPVRRDFSI